MSQAILSVIAREVRNAFRAGSMSFRAFGRVFSIEHVRGLEYRLTCAGNDVGVRFIAAPGRQLDVFLA